MYTLNYSVCLETYPKWLAYDERLEIQVEEFHQRIRSGTSMQMNELEGAAEERGQLWRHCQYHKESKQMKS